VGVESNEIERVNSVVFMIMDGTFILILVVLLDPCCWSIGQVGLVSLSNPYNWAGSFKNFGMFDQESNFTNVFIFLYFETEFAYHLSH